MMEVTQTIDDDGLSPLKHKRFSNVISEIEKLMSQSNRVFLLGAGCSCCAGLPLTSELTKKVLQELDGDSLTKTLLLSVEQCFKGSEEATIEDYMSELVDSLAIVQRREGRGASEVTVNIGDKPHGVADLHSALDEIKQKISDCIDQPLDLSIHQQFVRAVHRTLRAGKTGSLKATDYVILNYDTLIEDALALERLSYADGFRGGATGWWDKEAFNADGMDARVLKIHGSIDWCLVGDDTLPRRMHPKNTFKNVDPKEKVLIWPAATKYRETQLDPYAQLMENMRCSLSPSIGSEVVLTICGYSFGDSHINIEIDRALHESDGRLTLLIFTELDEPKEQMKKWLGDPAVRDQVRINAKRGFFHGDKEPIQSDTDLPWWKFEILTRLLGGER